MEVNVLLMLVPAAKTWHFPNMMDIESDLESFVIYQLSVVRFSTGMLVIGTAGTEEGLKLVKEQGAEHVFNHRT